MIFVCAKILNFLRYKIYSRFISPSKSLDVIVSSDRNFVTSQIIDLLTSDKPCMIARYGAYEGSVLLNYLGVKNKNHSYVGYIKSKCEAWWWNMDLLHCFNVNAGFYPLNTDCVERYCQLTLNDSRFLDMVGCFDNNCNAQKLAGFHVNCKYVRLACLEPDYFTFNAEAEWTSCLEGKRILVVHPFADTISLQYKNRLKLFNDPNFLPNFTLITLKAVQSIGGQNDKFDSWFDALNYMEDEMNSINYDIAIIGCGAYGFNLAAYAKRTGHKSIHLGGATQLLFGIMGKRWENKPTFKNLFNEFWLRPSIIEKPTNATNVENGCYW